MQKLKRVFLLISFFGVLFFSCKPYQIKGVSKINTENKSFTNHYFSNPATDYVYKTNIDVYGNKLGGIFIVKKINDSLHRVVFTTDFGNKLLDFEISDKACKVNYIVEALNRKIIINTLKNDFRLLLKSNYEIQEVFENETDLIYKAQDQKGYTYFFESKKDNNLIKLLHTSKTKEKVTFEFNSKNSTFAENIIITHHSIKLKLEFNQINN